MASRRINRLEWGGRGSPPENLAVFRVEAHGDLVSLARKLPDPAAREDRRCVALSNRTFHSVVNFSGQAFGSLKGAVHPGWDRAIAASPEPKDSCLP